MSAVLASAIAGGCAGKVSVANTGDDDDTPAVDAPDGDAPPAVDGIALTGKVMDYFANAATPVPEASVATDGITPPMTATGAAADALYTLSVPTGSKLFLTASHTGYRPTRNVPVTVDAAPVTQDIYAMTGQDIKTYGYGLLGKQPTAGTAFVTIDLRKNNGDPLTGVAVADIKLLDTNDPPAPIATQTAYLYNANGSLDPAETTSASYGTPPRARAGFVDVPPGNYQVSVTYTAMAVTMTELVSITVAADGATLAKTGNLAGQGGGNVTDPTFATDIYPRLQTAAKGGLGCANCHTATGSASILPYDGEAATVLAAIKTAPGVIDLTTPASSLFLTKPLYEQPPLAQNHPNATFLDINDPDYKLFLLWITNGAN